jgi:acyl phosphate:glycerol-3-phosphate acyltransferase
MELRVLTEFTIKVLLSYLLGSVVGSLLIGKLHGGVDIRQLGSGNAGGTNALRTQGKGFALWVMVIDVGKGWLATGVLAPLVIPGLSIRDTVQPHGWLAVACGVAAILGHVYPIFYGFRGGKGVATLVGAVLGLNPWLLVPMLVTWLLVVFLFGFVGLASILATVALAAAAALVVLGPQLPLSAFGAIAALLMTFTHRSNIARMRAGTEPRARRLWLFGSRSRGV